MLGGNRAYPPVERGQRCSGQGSPAGIGADDYVTKRFSPRALLAKVRAAIRRLNQNPDKRETVSFADVEVNFSKILTARVSENYNDLCYRLPVHRVRYAGLSAPSRRTAPTRLAPGR